MDYTLNDGRFYKVEDANGELITVGQLVDNEILSTIHDVEFITKEEFDLIHSAK